MTRDYLHFADTRELRKDTSALRKAEMQWLRGYDRRIKQVKDEHGPAAARTVVSDLAAILGIRKTLVTAFFDRLRREEKRLKQLKVRRVQLRKARELKFSFIVDMKAAGCANSEQTQGPSESDVETEAQESALSTSSTRSLCLPGPSHSRTIFAPLAATLRLRLVSVKTASKRGAGVGRSELRSRVWSALSRCRSLARDTTPFESAQRTAGVTADLASKTLIYTPRL